MDEHARLEQERRRLRAEVRRLTASAGRYLQPNPASEQLIERARARLEEVEHAIAEAGERPRRPEPGE